MTATKGDEAMAKVIPSESPGGKGIKFVHGHGPGPDKGGCVWDWTIYHSVGVWADRHPCFNPVLIAAGQSVNDRLSDPNKLKSFEPRLNRCRRALDPKTEMRINMRLALWCARRVEHLCDDPRVKACNDVTERYINGEASGSELATAAWAAWAAEAAWAAWAAEAAWAAWAAWAAKAAEAAWAAWAAEAAWAAWAAWAAKVDDALLAFLDELIDQWEKIVADEGAMADLDDPSNYVAVSGS